MDRLPDDIAAAIRTRAPRKGPRFTVLAESGAYPVLELRETGFDVAEADAPRLRGYVDILHGEERLARCLIICAEAENGIVRYDFKRRTEDGPQSPADYARDPDAPTALIEDLS